MNPLLQRVTDICSSVFGETLPISHPAHEAFGDYCVNVMQLRERPSQEKIASYIEALSTSELFEKIEQKGAFINMHVHASILAQTVDEILAQPDTYGASDWGAGQTWAVEHTSPNPNKAMHLGHLRNNVLSMALSRIWEKIGIRVIREAVDNNRGIAIARLMWGYLHYGHASGNAPEDPSVAYWFDHQEEWHTPETLAQNPGKFVDALYVQASSAYEAVETVKTEVRQLVIDWESGDTKVWELWKKVLSYSYAGQELTLARLDNHWDHIWHEHDHYQQGKSYVEQGLAQGIFVTSDEGTVITQLEKKYDMPDTVLLKSDGTSLYITQDIALTDLKIREHRADRLIWVVGPEQSLALKQLFAVCEQLGIGPLSTYTHITYGWMSLKGAGSMSSRKGTVVYIDDLLDMAVAQARAEIRNPDALQQPIEEVAERIGVGAVKYSLLKVGRTQEIAFDLKEAVRFEGNSGPYIQYAYARMMSLLRKIGENTDLAKSTASKTQSTYDPAEKLLMRELTRYPEVVLEAGTQYSPHLIAQYIYALTQKFNVFYEESPILQAPGDVQSRRLALVEATSHVVRNGLTLLGIEVVDAM